MLTIQGKVNIYHPLHLYSSLQLSEMATLISSFDLIFTSTLGVGKGDEWKKRHSWKYLQLEKIEA